MTNQKPARRSFKKWLHDEYELSKILLRSIPASVVALFVISVIAMNILANKTLVQTEYLALDGGILISWLSFLSMDIVVKHFGPKASNRMSIFAVLVNLLVCLIFFIASKIPSNSGEDYSAFNIPLALRQMCGGKSSQVQGLLRNRRQAGLPATIQHLTAGRHLRQSVANVPPLTDVPPPRAERCNAPTIQARSDLRPVPRPFRSSSPNGCPL